MPDLKPTVEQKMSRHDLLDWINTTVHGQYKKVDELCSGIAYCQLMELLFPQCIGIKKIKSNAKLEHEYLHNLKLLQLAFTRLKFDKTVPIERLLKGRFQDNFEFLQWFKKFFDTHAAGKANLKVPAALAAAAANAPKPVRKSIADVKLKTAHAAGDQATLKTTNNSSNGSAAAQKRSVSPSSFLVLQQNIEHLRQQTAVTTTERDTFYKKLFSIEQLINASIANNEEIEFCKTALDLIYADGNDGQQSGSESADL